MYLFIYLFQQLIRFICFVKLRKEATITVLFITVFSAYHYFSLSFFLSIIFPYHLE